MFILFGLTFLTKYENVLKKTLNLDTNILFDGAGIRTGGAFFTGVSVGAGLSALADPALAVTPAAAQQPHAGHAGVGPGGAVAALSLPAGVTLTEPTVTLPFVWKHKIKAQTEITPSEFEHNESSCSCVGVCSCHNLCSLVTVYLFIHLFFRFMFFSVSLTHCFVSLCSSPSVLLQPACHVHLHLSPVSQSHLQSLSPLSPSLLTPSPVYHYRLSCHGLCFSCLLCSQVLQLL